MWMTQQIPAIIGRTYVDKLSSAIGPARQQNTTMSDVASLKPLNQNAIDALPVHETSINQIDMNAVQEHIKGAIERQRYEGPSDLLDYLRNHNAVAHSTSRGLQYATCRARKGWRE